MFTTRGLFTSIKLFKYNTTTLIPSRTLYANTFKVNNLEKEITTTPKALPDVDKLVFGKLFTDHMLEIDCDDVNGWHNPQIKPYQPLKLDPACSVFHYALEAFEGLKAYVDEEKRIRLFRPDMNMARFRISADRLGLPFPDGNDLLDCIKELVKLDRKWIPDKDGYSLYIRPNIFATEPFIGLGPSSSCKIVVILSPVGPYYPEGFNAISLYGDHKNRRAFQGGAGAFKIGGNYAPTILPQQEASKKGYTQILWLSNEEYVTEVGSMNQFFFWVNKEGEKELITSSLDGTVLAGITRDSILRLTRKWGEFKVTERQFTIDEVFEACRENRMIEAFGAGTAAIVAPVKSIFYKGQSVSIPLDPDNPDSQAGKLTRRLADTIKGIQYGRIESEWSVILD